ncbi:hypothetical protein [Shouchella patagoniensis]|uniref:hypothetical protein n=1 Tax=Shouchella patagoniensis TaxID=228576 RepID=UPI001473F426|nr:hypothetical protein [Shouchella patagoniensis]
MAKTQFEKGFLAGQKAEAEVFLENLESLEGELRGVGWNPENSYIHLLKKDLKAFLDE